MYSGKNLNYVYNQHMKKIILSAIILTACSKADSQTMKIAHRSHSGSNASFHINTTEGNFGETPEMAKKRLEAKNLRDSLAIKHEADSIAKINLIIQQTQEVAAKAAADSLAKVNKKKKTKSKRH